MDEAAAGTVGRGGGEGVWDACEAVDQGGGRDGSRWRARGRVMGRETQKKVDMSESVCIYVRIGMLYKLPNPVSLTV